MIIVVSIGESLKKGMTPQQATERAWSLSVENCKKHEYVIGVESGAVKGYFRLNDVFPDSLEPERVAFDLTPCTEAEEQQIDAHIKTQGIDLKGVQRGWYI